MLRNLMLAVAAGLVGCGATPPNGDPSTLGACSSGTMWTSGMTETMAPGDDCNACHSFTAAGTVMGAPDDDTNCDGVADVIVRVTDASGEVHELVSNGAGNFFATKPIPTPYTAEVERDGVVVAMASAQTDASCNACHTSTGLGRVVAP
jgi:hypothetical protein